MAKELELRVPAADNLILWEHANKRFAVHVCHQYKHLGTWVQTKHKHARDIAMRGSAAKQQWGQLARSFFTKKVVILATKTKVFDSLVISKMLYNVHTWSGVHANDLPTWTNHLKGPIGVLLKGQG